MSTMFIDDVDFMIQWKFCFQNSHFFSQTTIILKLWLQNIIIKVGKTDREKDEK